MSVLSIFKNGADSDLNKTNHVPESNLESILIDLSCFGRPRLCQMSDGTWFCVIEVSVSPVGAKFEVMSDFKQPGPTAAATQCQERLRASLQALGGKT